MSIQHLIHCDGPECERGIPYSPLEWGSMTPLPDDWYMLSKGDRGADAMHFCSLACVAEWAAQVKRGPSALDLALHVSPETFAAKHGVNG